MGADAGARILAVIVTEHAIQLGLALLELDRDVEEQLGDDREELTRARCAVRVQDLIVLAALQRFILASAHLDPTLRRLSRMQWRRAVDEPVEHVELVREL